MAEELQELEIEYWTFRTLDPRESHVAGAAPELGARLFFPSLLLSVTIAAGPTGDATVEELLGQILIVFQNDGGGIDWLLPFAP